VKFNKWLDTLVSEKEIDTDLVLEVEGASGTNYMPLSIVLDAIKNTTANEQAYIKDMLVRIDFTNGDIVRYFKHLAQALAI